MKKIIDEELKMFYGKEHMSPEIEKVFFDVFQSQKESFGITGITTYVYKFTNENLKELFDGLDLTNKKVLTVGSSGDQALYGIFKGAKEVVLADANIFTRMFVELKIAAMKELSKGEFISYFNSLEENFFEKNCVYAKISHNLSPIAQNFWDTILLDGDRSWVKTFVVEGIDRGYVYSSFYRDSEDYKKMKNILKEGDFKLSFVYDELFNFPNEIKTKFDLILLSNIYDYVQDDLFFKTLENLYLNNLETGGAIQITSGGLFNYNKVSEKIKKDKAKFFRFDSAGLYEEPTWFVQKPLEKSSNKQPVIDENYEFVSQMPYK